MTPPTPAEVEAALAVIEPLAKEATPGPWFACCRDRAAGPDRCSSRCVFHEQGPVIATCDGGTQYDELSADEAEKNRSYIASVDPTTVLRLLAHVSALEQHALAAEARAKRARAMLLDRSRNSYDGAYCSWCGACGPTWGSDAEDHRAGCEYAALTEGSGES